MGSVQDYLKEVRSELSKLKKIYKDEGSTYSLIVSVSEMKLDLLRVVSKCQNTEFYSKSIKLNQDGHAFRKKLLAEISSKDLEILSKHGNSDADWILASQISENYSDKFESTDKKTKQKIWNRYIHHLERGVFVYNMAGSTAQRMIFLAEQFTNGFSPDYEKAILYLEMAAELGTEWESGEAHYNLWCIYIEELENKKKAKKHLLKSVNLKFPEALAAYGRAHWGPWIVEPDEKKAFKLIKKSSELGSEWGTELLADCYYEGLGIRKNPQKAFQLRLNLSSDDPDNCCNLAIHYLEGRGVKKNNKEGMRLLKKAIKLGSGKAHWEMASLYNVQNARDDRKRFQVLRQSVELESPFLLTFNELGLCYFHGWGTKVDYEKAREIFDKVIKVSTIQSQIETAELYLKALDFEDPHNAIDYLVKTDDDDYNIGLMYYDQGSFDVAVKFFRISANNGNSYSQNFLGGLYQDGVGVKQNFKAALKYFHLAAENGLPSALHNIGYTFEVGNGVPVNKAQAIKFYKKAANSGSEEAQNRLGAAYETGVLIKKNYKQAVKWYGLAAEQGDAMGQNNLASMYYEGTGVVKDFEMAMKLYRLSAAQDYAPAENAIGLMYSNGEGVSQNEVEAVKWYRLASQKGYHTAQYNLGLNYKNGDGVKMSNLKAYICFYLALGHERKVSQYVWHTIDDASGSLTELEDLMSKAEIKKAQTLAEKCVDSDYATWDW